MRWVHSILWQAFVFSCPLFLSAQETPATGDMTADEETIHNELRALREALTAAVLEGDVDAQLGHVHENVVVTWQNNQVVRTAAGLKDFLAEMDAGEERVFQGYTVPPQADELTILHGGDAGIAFGTSTPHYKYLGMEFDLENRWTATLVKEGDQWKLAAYHVSANLVDNPVLSIAKRSVYWTGGICLIVGLGLGLLLGKRSRRRSSGEG